MDFTIRPLITWPYRSYADSMLEGKHLTSTKQSSGVAAPSNSPLPLTNVGSRAWVSWPTTFGDVTRRETTLSTEMRSSDYLKRRSRCFRKAIRTYGRRWTVYRMPSAIGSPIRRTWRTYRKPSDIINEPFNSAGTIHLGETSLPLHSPTASDGGIRILTMLVTSMKQALTAHRR